MNVDDLSKLSLNELRKVKKKNHFHFHLLVVVDLLVFYHSLIYENWTTLFLSFGIFVAGLALYDNYRISKRMMEE